VTADSAPASTGAVRARIQRVGDRFVEVFTTVALFVIGGTILWSAVHVYIEMILAGRAPRDREEPR
jgi:hypothetical protein